MVFGIFFDDEDNNEFFEYKENNDFFDLVVFTEEEFVVFTE